MLLIRARQFNACMSKGAGSDTSTQTPFTQVYADFNDIIKMTTNFGIHFLRT